VEERKAEDRTTAVDMEKDDGAGEVKEAATVVSASARLVFSKF
jgi:hypothetical protein